MGLPKFPTYLFLHAMACGLRRIYPSSPITDEIVLPSEPVRSSASATIPLSKLYQHFRERGLPYGLQDSLSTLHLSCSPHTARLRHRRKTRYGWVANPYPTGTFTLIDTPDLAWRETGSDLTGLTGRNTWLCHVLRFLGLHTERKGEQIMFPDIPLPMFAAIICVIYTSWLLNSTPSRNNKQGKRPKEKTKRES